jgi:hypothetical protein
MDHLRKELSEVITSEAVMYSLLLTMPIDMKWFSMKMVRQANAAIPPPGFSHLVLTPPQAHMKLFAKIMAMCKIVDSAEVEDPSEELTPKQIVEKVKESIEAEETEGSHMINVVMLSYKTKEFKTVRMCRNGLHNYFVFRKYVSLALGTLPEHAIWSHWTSVRSSLMQNKYESAGIITGVMDGMHVLVLPGSKFPALAVPDSEFPSIVC